MVVLMSSLQTTQSKPHVIQCLFTWLGQSLNGVNVESALIVFRVSDVP